MGWDFKREYNRREREREMIVSKKKPFVLGLYEYKIQAPRDLGDTKICFPLSILLSGRLAQFIVYDVLSYQLCLFFCGVYDVSCLVFLEGWLHHIYGRCDVVCACV